jgi:hypothetical protein
MWSGHVSTPDPCLALIKVGVFLVSESRDRAVGGPDPTQRGPGPIPGVRFVPVEVLDPALRSGPVVHVCRGPAPSHGGPDPPLIPWRIMSSPATWRP